MDKEAKDKVINILYRAMQAETDGHLFYRSAAKNIEDPRTQSSAFSQNPA
jgi:rubrerythrin